MFLDPAFLALLQRLTSGRAQKDTTEAEKAELRSYLERVPMQGETLPPGVAEFDILATGMPTSNSLKKDIKTLFKVGMMTYVHKMIDFDTLPDVFLMVLQTCAVADPNFFKVLGLSKAFAQEGYATYAYGKIIEGKASPELLRIILVCAQYQHDLIHEFVTKPVKPELDPKYTRLHDAAIYGDAALVDILLEPLQGQVRALLSMPNQNGTTPVHYAIQRCNKAMLDVMVVALRRDVPNQAQTSSAQPVAIKQKQKASDPDANANEAENQALPQQAAQDNIVVTPIIDCINPDDAALKQASEQLASIAKQLTQAMSTVCGAVSYRNIDPKKKITAADRAEMLTYLHALLSDDYQTQALTASELGASATHSVFSMGDLSLAQQFMQQLHSTNQQIALLRTNNNLSTPIVTAAWSGHSALVQYGLSLLGDNAAVVARQHSKNIGYENVTLLNLVTRFCDDATVAAVLNIPGYDASSDMFSAMVQKFYINGRKECDGAHPLQFAVVYGGFDRVKLFVDKGLVTYELLQKTCGYKMFKTDTPFMMFMAVEGDPESLALLMSTVTPAQAYALLTCTYDSRPIETFAELNSHDPQAMLAKIAELKQQYQHAKNSKLTLNIVAQKDDGVIQLREDVLPDDDDDDDDDEGLVLIGNTEEVAFLNAQRQQQRARMPESREQRLESETPLGRMWSAAFSQSRQKARKPRESALSSSQQNAKMPSKK